MLQKILLLSLVVCLLSSCKKGPLVTVCISDPPAGGMDCYDQVNKKSFFILYAQTDKYVALPPADAESVLNFCAQGK